MRRGTLVVATAVVLALGTPLAWSQRPGAGPGPGGRGAGNALLRLFDANGDGSLSANEIEGASAKLKALDASQDGNLSADELRQATGPGPGPGAVPKPVAGRGGPANPESNAGLEKPPIPRDEDERRILSALDQARQGQRYANVSTSDGRLLRQLTEALGAKRVVELGTSTGESGLWFSMALRKTGGHLYTHDIDPGRIAVARANFQRAGVDHLITIVEGDAHATARQSNEPIDVLFIDAEKEGYDAYLRELLPLVRPGGLIIAHNMHRPAPNPRYIEAITTNPDLDTSFVLMDGAGVGITLKKR